MTDSGRTPEPTPPPNTDPPLGEVELNPSSPDRFMHIPEGRGLRRHAVRGVVINASFNIGLAWIGLLHRFLIAAFLTTSEYGLWGLLVVVMMTLLYLREVGIGDKYVQQNELDQEVAFHKAYSLEVVITGVFFLLTLAALPLFALLYDEPSIILPGAVFALALPLGLLTFPRIVFYRRMQYFRQRVLEAIEPIVGIVVTLTLGALGAGYWSLIGGALAGGLSAGIAVQIVAPYRFRWRYDRGTVREYWSFSWPLLITQGTTVLMIQAVVIAGKASVGLAGLGVIALANTFSQLADRIDVIVTRTLYPAICAVAHRMDLLHESFIKSNRLGVMWGMTFGLGLTLFASDLVHFVLSDKWDEAIPVMQAFGVAVAINQIGFNWSAYMRARNDTRGLAVVGVGSLIGSLVFVIPPLIVWGIEGYAVGEIARVLVLLVLRGHYLRVMFRGFSLAKYMLRAILPSIPAVMLVLALRIPETGERSLELAIGELTLYVLVTAAATWLLERDLLREFGGYLRGVGERRAAAAA